MQNTESDVVEVTVPNAEITYAAGSQTIGTFNYLSTRELSHWRAGDVQGKVLPRDFTKTALSAVNKLRRSNQVDFTPITRLDVRCLSKLQIPCIHWSWRM